MTERGKLSGRHSRNDCFSGLSGRQSTTHSDYRNALQSREYYSDLAALVREAIDAEPYRVGPRMAKLKRLLALGRLA